MDLMVERVAGLDVHRDSVMACVRTRRRPDEAGSQDQGVRDDHP